MAENDERHYDLEPDRRADDEKQAEGELLGDVADKCPNCGTPLGSDEVLCLKCGYDLQANVVRKPKVAIDEDTGDEADEPELFVEPGRGSAAVLAVGGGIITVAAMIVAGANTLVTGPAIAAAVALPLYEVVLHTASGVLAVFIVSKLVEERFGSAELAAARILVAFSLFQLFLAMDIPVPGVGEALAFLLGLGAYWVAVWFFFQKTPAVTLLIMAAHIVLWAFIRVGAVLYEAATPVPPAT